MTTKQKNIFWLCFWVLLTFLYYNDALSGKVIKPTLVQWFLLIVGPLFIVFYIWMIFKDRKEE